MMKSFELVIEMAILVFKKKLSFPQYSVNWQQKLTFEITLKKWKGKKLLKIEPYQFSYLRNSRKHTLSIFCYNFSSSKVEIPYKIFMIFVQCASADNLSTHSVWGKVIPDVRLCEIYGHFMKI